MQGSSLSNKRNLNFFTGKVAGASDEGEVGDARERGKV